MSSAPVVAPELDAARAVPSGPALAVKRAMDVVLSLAGLVVTAPLLGVVLLLARLGSRGSPIFRQQRVGQGGRLFTIMKVRTMRHDAEAEGPQFPRRRDGRVTRLGSILRPLGIDELPQLWNVLRGDMSLVGPRPEQPLFARQFAERIPGFEDRHLVRPGITGWAQVNGLRGDVPIEDRVRHDLEYLRRWSLLLDVEILVRTIGVIWRDASEVSRTGR